MNITLCLCDRLTEQDSLINAHINLPPCVGKALLLNTQCDTPTVSNIYGPMVTALDYFEGKNNRCFGHHIRFEHVLKSLSTLHACIAMSVLPFAFRIIINSGIAKNRALCARPQCQENDNEFKLV